MLFFDSPSVLTPLDVLFSVFSVVTVSAGFFSSVSLETSLSVITTSASTSTSSEPGLLPKTLFLIMLLQVRLTFLYFQKELLLL
jgi:hypothetical protein